VEMATNSTQRGETSRGGTIQEKYFAWMVLAITAVTYVSTLRFDFVYDDYPQIVFNPFVKAWHYVPEYFVSSVWKQMAPFAPGNYYRPLFLLLLRVNYSIFANRPLGWHLVSLALHLLVTWQVFVLVRRMTGQFTLAWLSAAIFGIHPVHHEVVAWVSGVTESQFAVMFLAAFITYLKSKENSKTLWMAVSCAFYVLALLSKETAIVLPALVFAFEWIGYEPAMDTPGPGFGDRLKKAFVSSGVYLPIAILYLLVRNQILMGLGHSWAPIPFTDWLLTVPSILLLYLRNCFFPVRLSESYDVYYQHGFSFGQVALPMMILIAFAAAVWMLRGRLGAKAVGYAAAWILIPLLPALDTFVFRPDELVHDRYLYIPSIGVALLVALVIDRVAQTRPVLFGQPVHAVAGGIAITVVLCFFSVQAVSYWTDDYTLFTRAHQVAPLNGTAGNNLSAEMIARQELDPALAILLAAYQRDPADSRVALNLGRVYYRKKDLPKAEFFIQRGIVIDPGMADLYVIMGQIRLNQNRNKEAQDDLRQAVTLDPYSAPYHTSYGIVLALNGNCADADRQFDTALSLNPGDALTELQRLRCRAALAPTTKPG
jgi:tetratricopeptide (TPR) repeat protein